MNRLTATARIGLAWVMVAAVTGCAGMRTSQHAPTPAAPPPSTAVDNSPEPQPAETTPPPANSESRPAETSATAPPCTCAEVKAKPKPKPKPKPVHKEAPPQLPTAPVVAETPPGGVVEAQVRAMPVSVMSILGKRVKGPQGEDLGRVVDVLADASGRVRIAIIDFGGFLGVGNHRIAVEWPLLRFSPDGTDPSLLLSLSLEQLRKAPEYKDDPRPRTLMEPTAAPAAPATTTAPAATAAPAATTAPAAPAAAPTPATAPPPEPKK